MRVTQSMLSNNMLRNLSSSYNKMGKLQNQLDTGKKVNRPSDDPVVVMKGMGYRMQVDKVAQFQRNLGEANNYLDSSDDALDKVGQAMHRAKELVTSAANGTLTPEDKEKIQSELDQLRNHIQDLANTKVGDKYLFSGTKTSTPLFDNGYTDDDAFKKSVDIEVFDGVTMNINTDAAALFKGIDDMFSKFNGNTDFSAAIADIDANMDKVLTTRADIGARQNRVEMMSNRLDSQEASAKKQMSENEDIDYEKAITDMLTQESIHRAALSVGSRIIQPSLVDFLR
ncbi:flagellar hook-associated protein FlgL [Sporosarcina sp. E16_3]|uniref:flagellar hook-associated protein FlgL n=1 Tax=Sporosarcina sp. E16_3 TaxID=2789293 RepID=UPI001A926059|nr:flagellar hook-associated protein FlgL [Sporosarcina sp. E16_3]MBO0601190.1 flagellar hook-associated protein FlgL [Sporosarcina sp. E16_3]